jgi:hypothetical protein
MGGGDFGLTDLRVNDAHTLITFQGASLVGATFCFWMLETRCEEREKQKRGENKGERSHTTLT